MFFLLLGIFLGFYISFGCLFELFRNIANSSPILSDFFLLSSHFDKKSSSQNLLIKASPDEIDGINFTLKDNFIRSRVILLNFDKIEFRECFFHIFLHSVKITLDEIE
jgi:hypothetical protein